MEIFIMVAQLILALSILVSLHELGHFLAARYFGIKVEKFFVFFDAFGFKLFSIKKGDTEYGIGWLPLGGYVKIAGMIDESMDKKFLKNEPQPWEFRSKPAWQRLIVMVAGVFVNAVLGVLIFSFLTFYYGEQYLPNENLEHGIVAHELGQNIGLENGDKILKINGEEIVNFEDLSGARLAFSTGTVLTIERNGEIMDIKLPENFFEQLTDLGPDNFIDPRFTWYVAEILPNSKAQDAGLTVNDRVMYVQETETIYFDQFQKALLDHAGESVLLMVKRDNDTVSLLANVSEEGLLGFKPASDLKFANRHYGFIKSFPRGMEKAYEIMSLNIRGLGKVITGQVAADKALAGPIGIAQIFGGVWDWQKFWLLTGMISLILAFINILPIPALDGGHAMFLTIEIIRGKPLNDKVLEVAQYIGFILLIMLMIFVFYIDIAKLKLF